MTVSHAGIFHNILGSGSVIGMYIMTTDANNAVRISAF
jgi:hypothetical protein